MVSVFVLEDPDGEFAVWGGSDTPSGPIAFGTPAGAERFRMPMPTGETFMVKEVTTAELVAESPRRGWTELWAVGEPDADGNTWFAHALAE